MNQESRKRGNRKNAFASALLPAFLLSLFILSGCTSPGVSGMGGNLSVTGGISGTTQTTDGKDLNYDLHGTWTAPTPAPAAPPASSPAARTR